MYNRVVKRKLLFIGIFFFSFFLSAVPTLAALDVTVSPVFFNYSPKPGDSLTDKITLRNNSGTPVSLTVSVNKMTINDQGDIVPEDIQPGSAESGWFRFSQTSFLAPAREWVEVPLTINIPQDAAYGQYFAVVFSAAEDKVLSGASVQGNILVPVLLNVRKEGSIAKADISGFSVKNFVSEYLPVEFTINLKNSGNIHLAPRGNIFIRSQAGKQDLAVLEVNPGSGFVLPNATREFTASWNDGFIVKNPDGSLKFNWNKLTSFRLGKYSAYALLVYDDGQRDIPIESTITFWVFPYTAFAIILASLIIIIAVANLAIKTAIKKEASKITSIK